ncbi:MAG: acyl-CoA thioesterase [Anaerolineales bacterium]|nr:acyl-CoA thioesterase [Anaerolineales bacterium]
MNDFRFYHPIEVRYGDLDPQGHVNNARYLTYMEQARIAYIQHLALWKGGSFMDIGIILADVQVTFLSPILFGEQVRVWLQVNHLGNKSITMDYLIDQFETGQKYATGSTVLVAFDYREHRSIPVPETWRSKIMEFERLPEKGHP